MFKTLNAVGLGISGRQSELIELALTYGYRGLDVDIADMLKRMRSSGLEGAGRYLKSAPIEVGGFEIGDAWQGTEPTYRSSMTELEEAAQVAGAVKARFGRTVVHPTTDLPYNEAFERARQRLSEISDVLAKHEIKLAVGFSATPNPNAAQDDRPFIHQAEALLTLIKTIGNPNVGLALDTWHWVLGGGGRDQLSEVPESIFAVRLVDGPAGLAAADAKPEHRLLPQEDGLVDLEAIVGLLSEADYEGPVTMCADPSAFGGKTRDAIVQAASTAIDQLYAAAGLNKSGRPLPAVPAPAEDAAATPQ